MKSIYKLKKIYGLFWLIGFLSLSLSACKDNDDDIFEPEETPEQPANGTRTELTKDSIYLYAKQVYLWNDAIPEYDVFNPRRYRQYSDQLDNYNKELFDITQLKINPATGKPYEFVSQTATYPKYSYITDKDSNNPAAGSSVPKISEVT